MAQRLQKIIAEAGLMSRRAAEDAIRAGRVQLNGRTAQLGDRAEQWDDLLLDGRPLPQSEEKKYYILNKPRGYVCSLRDEKGRRSVRELLPPEAGRVYPVGRLDFDSEGLLLLTNDGDMMNRVLHPSREVSKVYLTKVSNEVSEEEIRLLRKGVMIDGKLTSPASERLIRKETFATVLLISIHEGRNRQVRKMIQAIGHQVVSLKRVEFGPVRLGDLPSGQWRRLDEDEVRKLKGM